MCKNATFFLFKEETQTSYNVIKRIDGVFVVVKCKKKEKNLLCCYVVRGRGEFLRFLLLPTY